MFGNGQLPWGCGLDYRGLNYREMDQREVDDGDTSALAENDEQKRALRMLRRGYRADSVRVIDNGWQIEVRFMDGSTATVSSKMLKIKAAQLQPPARE